MKRSIEWEYNNEHMDVRNTSEFRLTQAQRLMRKIIGAMENSSSKEIQGVGFFYYEKEVTNQLDILKPLCEPGRKIKESRIPENLGFPVPQHKEETPHRKTLENFAIKKPTFFHITKNLVE